MDAQEAAKWLDIVDDSEMVVTFKHRTIYMPMLVDGKWVDSSLAEILAAHSAQVEAQLRDSQGEAATIRRHYLHEKVEREKAEAELVKLRSILITARCAIRFFGEWESTIGKDKARECREIVTRISEALGETGPTNEEKSE
jgi:hypothetical protein